MGASSWPCAHYPGARAMVLEVLPVQRRPVPPIVRCGSGPQSRPRAVPTCGRECSDGVRAWGGLWGSGSSRLRPVAISSGGVSGCLVRRLSRALPDLEELVFQGMAAFAACLPGTRSVSRVPGTCQARVLLLTLAGACGLGGQAGGRESWASSPELQTDASSALLRGPLCSSCCPGITGPGADQRQLARALGSAGRPGMGAGGGGARCPSVVR